MLDVWGSPMNTPSASSGWWYMANEERHGPVSDQELQHLLINGTLGPSSLVWKKGMESWQDIGQVQALALLLASLPPELPKEPSEPQQPAKRFKGIGWPKFLIAVFVVVLIARLFGVVVALVAVMGWALYEGFKNPEAVDEGLKALKGNFWRRL